MWSPVISTNGGSGGASRHNFKLTLMILNSGASRMPRPTFSYIHGRAMRAPTYILP